jgi:thymidine kinase
MSLELIIGPMFSGKSTKLIRKVQLARTINKKVLVIKPSIETRYGEDKIFSHSLQSEICLSSSKLELFDDKIHLFDLIVIDEGQFFPDLKKYVLKWVEIYKKNVLVGGLDGDSERNPFGEILFLIPYADKVKKLSSLCKLCNDGTVAIFTKRLIPHNEQIQVGGSEIYIPLCRKHYLE